MAAVRQAAGIASRRNTSRTVSRVAYWPYWTTGDARTWSRKLPITATDSGLDSHLPVITAALCVCSACT
eukprot:scaffold48578_cov55-Phaeocystis_antarctica.AAC.2